MIVTSVALLHYNKNMKIKNHIPFKMNYFKGDDLELLINEINPTNKKVFSDAKLNQ